MCTRYLKSKRISKSVENLNYKNVSCNTFDLYLILFFCKILNVKNVFKRWVPWNTTMTLSKLYSWFYFDFFTWNTLQLYMNFSNCVIRFYTNIQQMYIMSFNAGVILHKRVRTQIGTSYFLHNFECNF